MLNYLVPILVASVGWFLYEPVSLLASFIFSTTVLISALTKRFRVNIYDETSWLILILPTIQLISAIINGQSFVSMLTGSYQRNFGILFWISISLLFILIVNGQVDENLFLRKALLYTCLMSLAYGILQTLKIDPISWENPYDAVQLTLGNPNFAGAFLGMISILPVAFAIREKNKFLKMYGVAVFILTIFIALMTKSLQAIVIILLSLVCFFIVKWRNNKNLRVRLFRYISTSGGITLIIMMPFILFTKIDFLQGIQEKLFYQGSISQRIDYWRTGINIFRDHPWFGVGPDQFQRYAALYRTNEQIIRDGDFVIPDKAHNVLIDLLANGGIFAGLSWVVFIFLIFKKIISLAKENLSANDRDNLSILSALWVGYVFQSFISPDQIVLSVIGFTSAALIVKLFVKQKRIESNLASVKIKLRKPLLWNSLTSVILIISTFVWLQSIFTDVKVKNLLGNQILTKEQILGTINRWPSPKTTEIIAVAISRADSNCEIAPEVADRIIEVDDRSAQGWYLKAICFNVNREFDEALNASENALKFDPINPTYLVAKAKLGIAAGNKVAASEALSVIKSNYPDNPEIAPLESSISLMP